MACLSNSSSLFSLPLFHGNARIFPLPFPLNPFRTELNRLLNGVGKPNHPRQKQQLPPVYLCAAHAQWRRPMKILVVYATSEGQTQKIAEFISKELQKSGAEVELKDSKRRMTGLDVSEFDGAVLAGSVHLSLHQETLTSFIVAHRGQLENLPTLLISVSLSIAFQLGEREANRYVNDLIDYTSFEPTAMSLVAGALKFDQYDYFMEQIIEHVLLDEREQIHEDKEFTNLT